MLVNFYRLAACTNCHWMKANMFTRPEIEASMQKFVLVELFADAGDATSDANQKLEVTKFNTVAEPFYVFIMAADESVVATFPGLDARPGGACGISAERRYARRHCLSLAASGGLPQFAKIGGGVVDPNGKVAVVNFWATWCANCIEEFPSFEAIDKEYGSKGVVVVGVATMDEGRFHCAAVPQKSTPWTIRLRLVRTALSQQYSLDEALPVTLVFDKSGKQVKRFVGAVERGGFEGRGSSSDVTRRRMKITESSGNVFLDLSFSPAEARNLRMRSQMMMALHEFIDKELLTQSEAAKLLKVMQPRISDLTMETDRFSIDTPVNMLADAGLDVDLRITAPQRVVPDPQKSQNGFVRRLTTTTDSRKRIRMAVKAQPEAGSREMGSPISRSTIHRPRAQDAAYPGW